MKQKKKKTRKSFFSKVKDVMKEVGVICGPLIKIATLVSLVKQIFH